MSVYDVDGNTASAYAKNGTLLSQAFDVNGAQLLRKPIAPAIWFINQTGYDADKAKRATYLGTGSVFSVKSADTQLTVLSGSVTNGVADFSSVQTAGEYYLEAEDGSSYNFKIATDRIWSVSASVALAFMSQARQDAFDTGGNTGYAWRDSHQFSFELNGLVMQYMSDPSYYASLPYGIYKANECEYADLRTQDCPDIIWLMKFAVTRYYDWNKNNGIKLHALIKGQVAYFLYIYPYISSYVDATWYQEIRDWIIGQWSETTCNKSWYEVSGGINNSLFETQSKIGTIKGQLPPGYAIVPNLMMYEVATRDGLASASSFATAAENNIKWLVNNVDLKDPTNTKGQRMSEHITFHALTYAYEMYPSLCPSGTYDKILEIADLFITRAANYWDYVQYQTSGESAQISNTIWVNPEIYTSGLSNQPGNVAGFAAVAYSLSRVINDSTRKAKLKQLAVAHLDHCFGRNPLGRCFDYKATEDLNDAKVGWVSRYSGGYGHLDNVVGVLDGSPKNTNYPFVPDGDTGYTEGWVAFNSAWNMALAYLRAETSTSGIGVFAPAVE